jgi:hypothetical protein
MSSSVSQIEYWREVNKPDKNTNSTNVKAITEGGPGAIYLSYDVFLGLSVIGGLLALDHLYLRSPMTFIAKIIVNVLTLGTWWLYDASQAVFNKDTVKVFGLGVPGMGPKGIAAGVLGSDVPDKKHMSFFIYGLGLLIGGIFGLDSFIVGDKMSGFIRLVCLITGILAPVAIFWWLFNTAKFLFKTKDVTNQYWEYFGAPQPAEHRMTWGEKLATKFPFLQKIFGPIATVKNAVVNTAEGLVNNAENLVEAVALHPINTAEEIIKAPIRAAEDIASEVSSVAKGVATKVGQIVETPINMVSGEIGQITDEAGNIITKPLNMVGDKASSIISNASKKIGNSLTPAITAAGTAAATAAEAIVTPVKEVVAAAAEPFVEPVEQVVATAQNGISAVRNGISLGKNALNTGSTIADKALNVAGNTAKAATAALALAPQAAALSSGLTTAAAKQALSQSGGGDSTILPYVLMGTLAIIVVSGLVVSYRRYRQNGQPQKNDEPPEPGVLRKSNQEKSS